MIFRTLAAAALLAFLAPIAHAQEQSTAVTYSPDFCEFEVTFPEAPYTSRRCKDAAETACYDLTSFTQVYALSSTVNFRVICNPVDENVIKDYSPEVMEATLRALTKGSVVKTHTSGFREGDGYTQSSLVGEGMTGRTPMIYIGQLWIGQQSAMTVEAELIGEEFDEADQLFGDILKSVRVKAVSEPSESAEKNAKEEAVAE